MKFSLRIAALILLCIGIVILYGSKWFSSGGLESLLWNSIHEIPHHNNKHSKGLSIDQMPSFRHDVGTNSAEQGMIHQCALEIDPSNGVAIADVKSWKILENLTPEAEKLNGVYVYESQIKEDSRFDPAAEAKANKRPLKVILVPHSHCDPGWQKTVDGYFEDQVKPTLDNMVEKLMTFPKMTFIWAESVFLSLWWKGIDDNKKADVKRLIKEGRFEIVVGSWVVPDEANTHYYALIDQMVEGHQWLWENIGVRPNNTWSLDPFGYSSGIPYLYKLAGFENMVILRVHEHVKNQLMKQNALEFRWRQMWDQNGRYDIRTQMMPYKLYNIKHSCGPDRQVCLLFDFRNIPGEISESQASPITQFNVDRLSAVLLGQYYKKAKLFRHNVLLVPLGDDFRYDRSIEWDQQYKNYMMLFNHMNSQKEWNIQARFGTLQDYFNELDKEMELDPTLKLPILEGDFFPYTDEHGDFWTGYFTSRAYGKNLGREVESHIRTADILNAISIATGISQHKEYISLKENLRLLEDSHQSLGLFQHHDAITGTARSYVVKDYEARLNAALKDMQSVILNSVKYLLSSPLEKSSFTLDIDDACSLRAVMQKRKVLHVSPFGTDVIFVNSLSTVRHELVHLLVSSDTVEVMINDNNVIPSQTSPVWMSMELLNDRFELMFFVMLSPMSITTYNVRATARNKGRMNSASLVHLYNTQDYRVPHNIRFQVLPGVGLSIMLENNKYRLRFSGRSGLMHSVTTKSIIKTTKLDMRYLMYKSRGSGAYIFNPAGPATDNELSIKPSVRVIRGPLVSEVHIVQNSLNSKVSIYNTTSQLSFAISIEHVVDLRVVDDKELVMRFNTDLHTNGTFYTDMNGLEMIRRKRNPRFPVQANYYPMTSMSYIEDMETRLTIATAQPLGLTSPTDGSLEVMLDRRLNYDDGRGLGEGVLDNKATPSRFLLFIEHPNLSNQKVAKTQELPKASPISLLFAESLNYPIFTLFTTNRTKVHLKKYLAFSNPLPCDMHVVSMRTIRGSAANDPERMALILHRQAYNCAFRMASASCPAQAVVRLDKLLNNVSVKSVKETTLSLMHSKTSRKIDENVVLRPMELATYILAFQ